mmetsp:Transcript_89612/g.164494  ORF Transcript_89612/g.164494 Transcript_89612/m.164494 type:complete len:156 (-) Transcript_89612:25-492(-)
MMSYFVSNQNTIWVALAEALLRRRSLPPAAPLVLLLLFEHAALRSAASSVALALCPLLALLISVEAGMLYAERVGLQSTSSSPTTSPFHSCFSLKTCSLTSSAIHARLQGAAFAVVSTKWNCNKHETTKTHPYGMHHLHQLRQKTSQPVKASMPA